MSKAILKEIQESNKEKGGISEVLIHRHISTRITSILVHTKVDPDLITLFSVILAFIAAIFFLRADYVSLIIGVIFLNLSYVFDCVDGELARYMNLNKKFGAWWDGICDRISEYAIFSGLILGLYFKTINPIVLILGFFAFSNLMMISFIRSRNRVFFDAKPQHETHFFGKYYLGRVDFVIMLITILALLNQVYYFLLIFTVLGAVVWIRQIYKRVINVKYKSHS
ncbi:MAG: CDP-alcohol phosphatidyltransferase family protein [Nanoarchaeota archaeon]|nr:CDP-alcohol phosphatidyltransferase family protein [Nanoarchaeota archaeon]